MVAWNFVPTEVLHVRCMGRVLKIDFVPVFNTTPRARICMNFQTVFADSQLVVSSTKCIRSWFRCTAVHVHYFRRKIWITEILIWKSALYWKTLTSADYSRIFSVFMRACMRSGNLKQICWLLIGYSLQGGQPRILPFIQDMAHTSWWRLYFRGLPD